MSNRICATNSGGAVSFSAAASVAANAPSSRATGDSSICGAMSASVLLSLARHLSTSPESSRCEGSAGLRLGLKVLGGGVTLWG